MYLSSDSRPKSSITLSVSSDFFPALRAGDHCFLPSSDLTGPCLLAQSLQCSATLLASSPSPLASTRACLMSVSVAVPSKSLENLFSFPKSTKWAGHESRFQQLLQCVPLV